MINKQLHVVYKLPMIQVKANKKSFGNWAEKVVCIYLQKQGFKVLVTNYRRPFGEIDVIAQTNDLLVFVEVKARTDTKLIRPTELILASKKKKIINTAKDYLMYYDCINDFTIRFDVALVEGSMKHYSVTYIANAFQDE